MFFALKTVLLLFLLGAPVLNTCTKSLSMQAHLSSQWYPNDPVTLMSMLNKLDAKSAEQYGATLDPHEIRALVVPHAGYAYSGIVAAATYKTIAHANMRRVIILAPSHYKNFTGVKLPTFSRYRMPQADVIIDTVAVHQLSASKLCTYDSAVFAQEHAIEVQLPFIQKYLGSVSVVPLIVGDLTPAQIKAVSQILAPLIDKQTLVLVSTDFTHYGKQFHYTPFVDYISERIQQLDAMLVDAIQHQHLAPFLKLLQDTQATVCGRMPLALLLALSQDHVFGNIESRLIAYETSSDAAVTGSSVSYVGLVFTTQKRSAQPLHNQFTSMELRALLALSKNVLSSLYIPSKKKFLVPVLSTAGDQKRGVFVTLYKNKFHKTSIGDLRGCIGTIEPTQPLTQGIIDMTKAAALHDTRFPPVTAEELPDITMMLSILSEPVKISSYRDIQLGLHGIILKNDDHKALFLPKVPLEFGWDLSTTLTQLSEKAGLPGEAWKDSKTEFQVFTSLDTSVEPAIATKELL